jgi:hypothetical protein
VKALRTAVVVGLFGMGLAGAFTVPLGTKTLAQHIDTIGETPQARALLDGTRQTINPALQEARDRVLGEYVEAPTHLAGEASQQEPESSPPPRGDRVVSTATQSKLPGRAAPGSP